MMMQRTGLRRRHDWPGGGRAYSLVEVIVAMMVLSVLFVAVMNTVGAARGARLQNVDRARGELLAADLMSEILQTDFAEPGSPTSFGVDFSESTGDRSFFDDVDDYHNWMSAPPQMRDGMTIPDAKDFERSVAVAIVMPASTTGPAGMKQIDVTVLHRGKQVVALSALRTQAWQQPGAAGGVDDADLDVAGPGGVSP